MVTGGNKGIGFALVKRFAELGVSVVLTARNKQRGEAAVETLREEGFGDYVHFLLLDVSDPVSVSTFASSFKTKFGSTLDILVPFLFYTILIFTFYLSHVVSRHVTSLMPFPKSKQIKSHESLQN